MAAAVQVKRASGSGEVAGRSGREEADLQEAAEGLKSLVQYWQAGELADPPPSASASGKTVWCFTAY